MTPAAIELSRRRRGLAALVVLLLVLAVAVLVTLAVGDRGGPDAGTPTATPEMPTHAAPDEPVTERDEVDALGVLHAWDRARARAWARGDVAELRTLYLPWSVAGRRDAALLGRYVDRGLVVRDLEVQVLRARTLRRTDDEVVLQLTDRVVGGTAVGPGRRAVLPRDAASTRTVRLVRRGEAWRVASVSAPARW